MSQPPSTLASNNPFRRKAPVSSFSSQPSTSVAPPVAPTPFDLDEEDVFGSEGTPALPSGDQFRSQLQALAHSAEPPPTTSFQKPKVLKKVRVQSPPPSSPESTGAADRFPDVQQYDDDESSSSSSGYETDDGEVPIGFGQAAQRRRIVTEEEEKEQKEQREQEQGQAAVDESEPERLRATASWPQAHVTPPNPFQRTLRDLEGGALDTSQSPGTVEPTGRTLDVDAFKRLLLTGQGPSPAAVPVPAQQAYSTAAAGDGASITDASSISRQSLFDPVAPVQDTPRTSHEISEPEDENRRLIGASSSLQPAPTILRKKPPPPSSRHGKLIRSEQPPRPDANVDGGIVSSPPSITQAPSATPSPIISPSRQYPPTPSDVNKPLPPAPRRPPPEEDSIGVFDHEAAGKVPEPVVEPGLGILHGPRPPTPPSVSHAVRPSAPSSKKPAPPPRRQPHGRSDSKHTPATQTTPSFLLAEDTDGTSARRSSIDSTRSRSSSLRVSVHAPAPPPPRRPAHGTRTSSSASVASPSSSSGISPAPGQEPSPLAQSIVAAVAAAASPPGASPLASPGEAAEPAGPPAGGMPNPASSQSSTPHAGHHNRHGSMASTKMLSPPPPPPARNVSVRSRRTTPVLGSASSSTTGRAREGSGSGGAIPPPPPSRVKGSSKGSVDGLYVGNSAGVGAGVVPGTLAGVVAEEPGEIGATGGSGQDSSAVDLLAGLSELQREVDALRLGLK